MNVISPQTRFDGLYFCHRLYMPTSTVLDVMSCEIWQSCKNCENTRHVGLRSLKVIEFGTNRMGIYDFLLVTNSNFGHISHDLRAIRRRKGRKPPCRHTHVSFNAIDTGYPLRICWWPLYRLKLDSMGYIFVADCICLFPLCQEWWANC